MKTPDECAEFLRQYNSWRRGEDEDQVMPDPKEIGKAIDMAISLIEQRNELFSALEHVVSVWSEQIERYGHIAPNWAMHTRRTLEKAKENSNEAKDK